MIHFMGERAGCPEGVDHPPRGRGLIGAALPGVSVVCSPTTTEPLCGIAEPTLAVVAQGVKETTLNGRTFTYGAASSSSCRSICR
jgi:hypothetical protein